MLQARADCTPACGSGAFFACAAFVLISSTVSFCSSSSPDWKFQGLLSGSAADRTAEVCFCSCWGMRGSNPSKSMTVDRDRSVNLPFSSSVQNQSSRQCNPFSDGLVAPGRKANHQFRTLHRRCVGRQRDTGLRRVQVTVVDASFISLDLNLYEVICVKCVVPSGWSPVRRSILPRSFSTARRFSEQLRTQKLHGSRFQQICPEANGGGEDLTASSTGTETFVATLRITIMLLCIPTVWLYESDS